VVQRSSFFERLKNRWRSPSGMRVANGEGTPLRAQPQNLPAVPEPERLGTAKLGPREDALVALSEGFEQLGSLLRGVQVRLESQGGQVAAIEQHLHELPAVGKAQIELMQQMQGTLERHQLLGENLVRTIGGLPAMIENVQATLGSVQHALERAAAADARTTHTLEEFRASMDRIQGAIGEMVGHSRTQAEATRDLVGTQRADTERIVATMSTERARTTEALRLTVDELGKQQAEAARKLQTATQDGLTSLRRAHEDQSNRITRLVEQNGQWSRGVLVMMLLSLLALLGILFALLRG
jgi:hypothetical protein